jgi:hypothetical protein
MAAPGYPSHPTVGSVILELRDLVGLKEATKYDCEYYQLVPLFLINSYCPSVIRLLTSTSLPYKIVAVCWYSLLDAL